MLGDPQRLYAGEPCCKQFTVQGWKVLDCVKSLSIRRTRLTEHGFKSQSDHQGDLVLGMPKVAKFLVG